MDTEFAGSAADTCSTHHAGMTCLTAKMAEAGIPSHAPIAEEQDQS